MTPKRGNLFSRTVKRALLVTTDAVEICGWLFLIVAMLYLTLAAWK